MDTAAALEPSEPFIIYRSVNRDGQTFALEPLSRERLRRVFAGAVRLHPRVFIAHETVGSYEQLDVDLLGQVVQLLAGVSKSRLDEVGGVSVRDPVTNEEIDYQ
jgi:hypothetical protein